MTDHPHDRKQKILSVFRKADRASVYLEAAEATGWMVADAQKQGLTKSDGIEMAKQHLLVVAEVFKDFAENHLENACANLKPHIREVSQ